jgi:hypothetical protein
MVTNGEHLYNFLPLLIAIERHIACDSQLRDAKESTAVRDAPL